jgi:hypothetical protein
VIKADVNMTIRTEDRPDGVSEVVLQDKGTYAGAPTMIDLRGGSLLSLREADIRYPVDLRWDVGPRIFACPASSTSRRASPGWTARST